MSRIEVVNLRKRYGDFDAVNSINCEMNEGAFTVILGPSGCGKSTLLRMIAGLEQVTSGDILKNGLPIQNLSPKERGCAMVFQNYALYPHMTVRDNIGYGLKLSKLKKPEIDARVDKVVSILDLEGLLGRKPSEISGGQRQRVAIGRAIARSPEVFLFDEPLSNLDAKLRMNMRMELRKLHLELGTTTIYVTHDQVEAMTLADRIIIMNSGKIEQIGTPSEIYHSPASTFVAGFIGSPPVNLIQGRVTNRLDTLIISSKEHISLDKALPDKLKEQNILLGIRPEDFIQTNSGNGISAKVDFIEDLGSHRILHCIVNDSQIHVSTSLENNINIGDTIHITALHEKIHMFDRETGQRLN